VSFKRMSCTIAVSLLFVWPILGWAATASVDVSSGHISIVSDEAPLSSVADQLSKKAGISIYLDRSAETSKVSVDVRTTSLEKAVKSLAHPLNYVIVTDQSGRVIELRIFKNSGLKDSEYRLFAAPRPSEVKSASHTVTAREQVRTASSAPGTQSKQGSPQTAAPTQAAAPNVQHVAPLAGPSSLVTGEKAFQYSIWTTKRMMEAEQMRQNMQVKADQADTQEKQAAAVTTMTQMSANAQQSGTSPQQAAPGAAPAQQSQTQTQSFMQSSAQSRGLNNYIYYQQRAMRENYSVYNMRRGQ
jgi:hypothetical protein